MPTEQPPAIATAYAGVLYDVNPFDQPGVEHGKNLTYAMMGRKGYDPPEHWGWCYVDEVFFDLSDRATPQLGPIPRFD